MAGGFLRQVLRRPADNGSFSPGCWESAGLELAERRRTAGWESVELELAERRLGLIPEGPAMASGESPRFCPARV